MLPPDRYAIKPAQARVATVLTDECRLARPFRLRTPSPLATHADRRRIDQQADDQRRPSIAASVIRACRPELSGGSVMAPPLIVWMNQDVLYLYSLHTLPSPQLSGRRLYRERSRRFVRTIVIF